MAENYLFTVIIVNEKYEIIDGQHRFDVIKN
jgi:ParB-like chromosome segregation protein Spo0J